MTVPRPEPPDRTQQRFVAPVFGFPVLSQVMEDAALDRAQQRKMESLFFDDTGDILAPVVEEPVEVPCLPHERAPHAPLASVSGSSGEQVVDVPGSRGHVPRANSPRTTVLDRQQPRWTLRRSSFMSFSALFPRKKKCEGWAAVDCLSRRAVELVHAACLCRCQWCHCCLLVRRCSGVEPCGG